MHIKKPMSVKLLNKTLIFASILHTNCVLELVVDRRCLRMCAYVSVYIFPLFYLYTFRCVRDIPSTVDDSCICSLHMCMYCGAEVLWLKYIHHTTRTTFTQCLTHIVHTPIIELTNSRSIAAVVDDVAQNRYQASLH